MLGLHACTIPRKQFLNILLAFHSYNNLVSHCTLQFVFVGCLKQGLSHSLAVLIGCSGLGLGLGTMYVVQAVFGHGSLLASASSVIASEG